jgi:hypothetical protein
MMVEKMTMVSEIEELLELCGIHCNKQCPY